MVGTEIKERILDNQFVAMKMGYKVDKIPSINCENFQFYPEKGRYKIKNKNCNILETILLDIEHGTGNWVADVAKELGVKEYELQTIEFSEDLWKSHHWK